MYTREKRERACDTALTSRELLLFQRRGSPPEEGVSPLKGGIYICTYMCKWGRKEKEHAIPQKEFCPWNFILVPLIAFHKLQIPWHTHCRAHAREWASETKIERQRGSGIQKQRDRCREGARGGGCKRATEKECAREQESERMRGRGALSPSCSLCSSLSCTHLPSLLPSCLAHTVRENKKVRGKGEGRESDKRRTQRCRTKTRKDPLKNGLIALWPSTNGAIPSFLVLPGSELSITEITEYTNFSPLKPCRELDHTSE